MCVRSQLSIWHLCVGDRGERTYYPVGTAEEHAETEETHQRPTRHSEQRERCLEQ